MRNYTAPELVAIVGAFSNNRIELGNFELAVRHDDVTGRYHRVLFLDEQADVRVEVDLTPKSISLCDHSWADYWRDEIKGGTIRLGAAKLGEYDSQFRWLRTASMLYQRMEEPMREHLSMKEIGYLTNRRFLDEIDWAKFLLSAELQSDGTLTCRFQHCRRPVANLSAVLSRQLTDTSPYRQRLGARAHVR